MKESDVIVLEEPRLSLGDLFYMPATSNPVTIDVQDFSVTPSSTNSPTNLKIIKGSSGSASYVVTGLGGYPDNEQKRR